MKKITLLCCAALATSMAGLQAQTTSEMHIVPVDADGNANFDADANDYVDKIALTENADGSFGISGLTIEYGFYFLGHSDTDGTLYSLPGWAVTPAIETEPNPLSITRSSQKNYIAAQGTYDITFIPSPEGQRPTMNTFTITPVEGVAAYPPSVYLIKGTQLETVAGSDGLYSKALTGATGSFKVGYEPDSYYNAFIYGPADAGNVVLTEGVKVPLVRGANTSSTFSFTPEVATATPPLTISLVKGDEYILVGEQIITGIGDISSTDAAPAPLYNLSGVCVGDTSDESTAQLASGLYIARTADGARKFIVR